MMDQYRRSICLLLDGYSQELHRRIEDSVRKEQYSTKVVSGFRILVRRNDYFVAEHIERQIREEKVTDPFGEVSTFERIAYVTTTVLIKCSPPHVIMLDPPSTSQSVIHKLCEFVDFSIAVMRPEIDIQSWVKRVCLSKFRLRCDDIRIRNVDWGDGFTGTLTLCGEGDVLGKAGSLTKGRDHLIAMLGGKLNINNVELRVRLHNTGRIELSSGAEAVEYSAIYDLSNW